MDKKIHSINFLTKLLICQHLDYIARNYVRKNNAMSLYGVVEFKNILEIDKDKLSVEYYHNYFDSLKINLLKITFLT